MKEIGRRIWYEPAVAIGLLLSVAMLVVTILSDTTEWDWDTIILILGPLLTGLGARPFVKPTAKIEDEQQQKAISNLKTP